MFPSSFYVLSVLVIVGVPLCLVLVTSAIKILREYERAVVFTLGRFDHVKGPGLVMLVPFVQQMVRVDLRTQVIEIPTQDVISKDNVSMKVDAVLYFNVVDPERAIIKVQTYLPATNMLAQTTLRAVLGQHELDEMLSERKKLNTDVQSILDAQTETWGIKVSNVEIRTVELTENMVRAIAKQAEAERDRRAKIIHAEAEFQASQTLVNAARILGSIPAAMQLRYLQTLTEIGAEQNSTVVFPMPIDIIKPFLEILEKTDRAKGANGALNGPVVRAASCAPRLAHDDFRRNRLKSKSCNGIKSVEPDSPSTSVLCNLCKGIRLQRIDRRKIAETWIPDAALSKRVGESPARRRAQGSSRTQPGQGPGEEGVTVGPTPLAVRNNNAFTRPREHPGSRDARRPAVDKGQAQFKGGVRLGKGYAVKIGHDAPPPGPVLAQKALSESLDHVSHDHRARRAMAKDDLVEQRRASEPGLIDGRSPRRRWLVLERLTELQIPTLSNG